MKDEHQNPNEKDNEKTMTRMKTKSK